MTKTTWVKIKNVLLVKNYRVKDKVLIREKETLTISFRMHLMSEKKRIALIPEDINELQKVGFEDVLSDFMR